MVLKPGIFPAGAAWHQPPAA